MRYYSSSKTLQISLGLSILLHICIFVYGKAPQTFKKIEPSPIFSVEFLSPPNVERLADKPPSGEIIGETKIKKGKPGKSEVKEAVPEKSVPEPVERVVPDVEGSRPIKEQRDTAQPVLIPSPERLAQIDEEKGEIGEGGKDEETISLDSTDLKHASYLNGVKLKIEGVWRYPEAARKSALQGRGLVSFTIERDGTVSDIKLIASTGYPILDEEIKKAIRAASPFNPMAENMRLKRLKVDATFEYDLVVQRIWGR